MYINGNTGFKLTNEGVYVSYDAGTTDHWIPAYSRVPEVLFVGYVHYKGIDSDKGYEIINPFGSRLSRYTTNVIYDDITRLGKGHVKINFSRFLTMTSEEWERVFITITPGQVYKSTSSICQVSLYTKVFTGSEFLIGPNDGDFYIKVELL